MFFSMLNAECIALSLFNIFLSIPRVGKKVVPRIKNLHRKVLVLTLRSSSSAFVATSFLERDLLCFSRRAVTNFSLSSSWHNCSIDFSSSVEEVLKMNGFSSIPNSASNLQCESRT